MGAYDDQLAERHDRRGAWLTGGLGLPALASLVGRPIRRAGKWVSRWARRHVSKSVSVYTLCTPSLAYMPTYTCLLPQVYVVGPKAATSTVLRSSYGGAVDYYMSYMGESSMDGAVAGYRMITGAAPLYGRYAYGFWQCKEHYQHQGELLEAAATLLTYLLTYLRGSLAQGRPRGQPPESVSVSASRQRHRWRG